MALAHPLHYYLPDIAILAGLLPVATGLLRFRLLDRPLRVLFWYCVASLCTDAVLYALAEQGTNNMPFFHLFTVLQFGLLTGLYYLAFPEARLRRVLLLLALVFLVFVAYSTFFLQGLYEFNSYTATLQSLLLVVVALLYFDWLLRVPLGKPLAQLPLFWVTLGVITYFAGTMLLFVTANFFTRHYPQLQILSWEIHAVLNMTLNALLAVALWKAR